jgi:hypothetical protein
MAIYRQSGLLHELEVKKHFSAPTLHVSAFAARSLRTRAFSLHIRHPRQKQRFSGAQSLDQKWASCSAEERGGELGRPSGTGIAFSIFPAPKRWVKVERPSGAGFSATGFDWIARKRVLTCTWKRCSTQNHEKACAVLVFGG